jgi:hypothetical protein
LYIVTSGTGLVYVIVDAAIIVVEAIVALIVSFTVAAAAVAHAVV